MPSNLRPSIRSRHPRVPVLPITALHHCHSLTTRVMGTVQHCHIMVICPWVLVAIFSCVNYVDTMVMVRAPSPKVATMGKEPVTIECSYRAAGSDIVLGINWYRKTAYDDSFKLIAQIPNKDLVDLPPTFVDKSLASKGNITIITKGGFKMIIMEIKPAECVDEGTYECEVQVYGGRIPHKPKVQVHLNEEPSVPSLKQEPSILVENNPVTFTCTGTMGRPVGNFKWLVYKNTHSNSLEEVEMSGISSFSKISGSCSPVGKSTLAIMITSADKKVKCIVQQHAEEEVVQVSDERVLDVQYSVLDTEVYTRINTQDMPLAQEMVALEGDDVSFMCRARGNPRPMFTWSYLPLNGQETTKGLVNVVSHPELKLTNISTNHSGSYVCVTTNFIYGREHTETKAVRIIVKDKTVYRLDRLRTAEKKKSDVFRYLLIGGVVGGAMFFAMVVSLLSVLCYRRCERKENGRPIRYQGVKA